MREQVADLLEGQFPASLGDPDDRPVVVVIFSGDGDAFASLFSPPQLAHGRRGVVVELAHAAAGKADVIPVGGIVGGARSTAPTS